MGDCASAVATASRHFNGSRTTELSSGDVGSQEAPGEGPPLDTSVLELDQLVRNGIREAQVAAVSRLKHDRVLHLDAAQSYLIAALKRNGLRDSDLRAHLLAVLLKLGVGASALQDIIVETSGAAAACGQACAESQAHGPVGSLEKSSGNSTPEKVIARTPSDHSSADADEGLLRLREFDGMQEQLLLDDSRDDELSTGDAPPGEPAEDLSSRPDLVADHGRETAGSLRTPPLSIREESDHRSGTPCPTSELVGPDAVGADLNIDLSTAVERLSSFYEEQHLGDGDVKDTDGDLSFPKVRVQPTSPTPGASISRSSVMHNEPDDSVGVHSAKVTLGGSGALTSHQRSAISNSANETRQSLARLRAVQRGHLSTIERRRQSRSLGSSSEAQGAEGKLDAAKPQSPNLVSKRTGRQPLQSSSSGSQGTISDSDCSMAAKRASKKFASSVEAAAEVSSWPGEPQSRKWGTPPRTDAKVIAGDDDRADVVGGTQTRLGGQADVAHVVGKETVRGASPAPSCHAGSTKDSATPGLKRAIPSTEKALRNPLSQLELFSSGEVHHFSSADMSASPIVASPSLASLSLCGSFPPSVTPSPFCAGAVSRDLTPPMSSPAPPSDSNVSVHVLNGVTGDEEVRFFVPVEVAYSEKHFLSMLDRLCKQHAGQTLSDLNWLSQSRPGARLQRRKCDLSLVEELFTDRASGSGSKGRVLMLCTVPVRPPSELPACKVRLRNLVPDRAILGTPLPVCLRLDTSLLDAGRKHAVAFTHQWSNRTYSAEADVLTNQRGVEVQVPWQILAAAGQNTDGLYDVHLVIDRSVRSENRKTLTVGSAESEFSSSSTAATGMFKPIDRDSKQSSSSS